MACMVVSRSCLQYSVQTFHAPCTMQLELPTLTVAIAVNKAVISYNTIVYSCHSGFGSVQSSRTLTLLQYSCTLLRTLLPVYASGIRHQL